ncbi:MAG: 50S ribosomal protein L28 [Alphaproteobacteria bacterium]|nr:50S ribosomal protein L28 [Rickettsiales bacterium]
MSRRCKLSANTTISRGNRVSKSNQKTKRWFVPNLQSCKFPSKLGLISLTIASSTIRTIRKYGGIDGYLLTVKRKRLTPLGKKMRDKLKLKVDSVK